MPPPYPDITVAQRAAQIEAALADLENSFPDLCKRSIFVRRTQRGRLQSYVKIGDPTRAAERTAVLLVGGIHGRELAPPDSLIGFARNLLSAYPNAGISFPKTTVQPVKGDPVTYPEWNVSASDVRFIVENLDLYVFPLVNPDGREFDMDHLPGPTGGWRQNRRKLGQDALGNDLFGVDLNRNFDIRWRFEDYYDMTVYRKRYPSLSGPASIVEGQETYRGQAEHSEPETLNLESLIDSLPIHFYVDVHSFGRDILHSWGLEDDGDDPSMTFQTVHLDPKDRADGLMAGDALLPPGRVDYREFLPDVAPHRIRSRAVALGAMMRDAILRSAGVDLAAPTTPQREHSTYKVGPSAFLYHPSSGPSCGGSDDYACSRQFLDPNRQPIFSYTLEAGHYEELGFHCDYRPSVGHFQKIDREIHAALTELLTVAAGYSLAKKLKPSALFPCLIPRSH
jgi:hypothetical protein